MNTTCDLELITFCCLLYFLFLQLYSCFLFLFSLPPVHDLRLFEISIFVSHLCFTEAWIVSKKTKNIIQNATIKSKINWFARHHRNSMKSQSCVFQSILISQLHYLLIISHWINSFLMYFHWNIISSSNQYLYMKGLWEQQQLFAHVFDCRRHLEAGGRRKLDWV